MIDIGQMQVQPFVLVDGSFEHKQRRRSLYLLAFLGLCFSFHLRVLIQSYETGGDWLFPLLIMAAALSAAMAVYLRGAPALARYGAVAADLPPWTLDISEANLIGLLKEELSAARDEERPVGLMLMALRPVKEATEDDRERAFRIATEALSRHAHFGTPTFRVGRQRLAAITARLDAAEELEQLAQRIHDEVRAHPSTTRTGLNLWIGAAISSRGQVLAPELLRSAKLSLQHAAQETSATHFAVDSL
jgi:hypothetical protein